ncbi:class I SAM-dependent methyltransferase [Tabrizicola sp.]|uniref:class I SAM-dependent methyltransferase n=1 Tax=Tabrizicola sp. TaxID=2005166 RepID=UPI003F3FE3BB
MADGLTARYEAAAPTWGRRLTHLTFPAAYRCMVARALELFPPPAGRIEAVDLGAGDGALADALLDALGPRLSLTLVDRSPAMLRAAETRLGPRVTQFVVSDLDHAVLPIGGYDLVAAAHLLEHLPDPGAALIRMAELTKPGGIVILSVSRPHWCSRLVWLSWRHRRFGETEMRALLERAGLADVQCWRHPSGPPRRLSLAYAARRPA